MNQKEITLYTDTSTWFSPNAVRETAPYDRIAGMTIDGETMWADPAFIAAENSYRRTDTEAQTLVLPTQLALMTARYFQDFFAQPPRFYHPSFPTRDQQERSNCHRFGTALYTNRPQSYEDASGLACAVIDQERRLTQPRRQALGQLAVIGTDSHEDNIRDFKGKYALHTMLALDSTRYLQVMALSGNMGITYGSEETLAYYRNATPDAAIHIFNDPALSLSVNGLSREFVRRLITP